MKDVRKRTRMDGVRKRTRMDGARARKRTDGPGRVLRPGRPADDGGAGPAVLTSEETIDLRGLKKFRFRKRDGSATNPG